MLKAPKKLCVIFFFCYSDLTNKVRELKDHLEATYLRLENADREARSILRHKIAMETELQDTIQSGKNAKTELEKLLNEIEEA